MTGTFCGVRTGEDPIAEAWGARRHGAAANAADAIRRSAASPREFQDRMLHELTGGESVLARFSKRLEKGTVREGIRKVSRGIATNNDNAWNTIKRRWSNNRAALENRHRKVRRNLPNLREAYSAAGDRLKASTEALGERFVGEGRQKLQTAVNQILGADFDSLSVESKASRIEQLTSTFQKVELSKEQANNQFLLDMKPLMDELTSRIGLIASQEGLKSEGAQLIASKFIAAKHALERNDAFWYDPSKNSKLKSFIGEDAMVRLREIRADLGIGRTGAQVASEMRQLVEANVPASQRQAFNEARAELKTTGLTDAEASQALAAEGLLEGAPNFDPARKAIFDSVNESLQKINKQADDFERANDRGAVRFDRTTEMHGFNYYHPQYRRDDTKELEQDFDNILFTADAMTSDLGIARGDEEIGAPPIFAVLQQANRKYQSVADNQATQAVVLSALVAQTQGPLAQQLAEYGDVAIEMVNKNGPEWIKAASNPKPNQFFWHLPAGQVDPNNPTNNSDQFVAVLTYGKESPIPKEVKGQREVNNFETWLRESTTGGRITDLTSFMGQMHTRFNVNYPLPALVRDSIQAFWTISADQGLRGANNFLQEGTRIVMQDTKKIASYMFHRAQNSEGSAKKLAELSKDPELVDFVEFLSLGGTNINATFFSNDRAADANDVLGGGTVLTPEQSRNADRALQGFTTLSQLADVIPRYSAYKAHLAAGAPKEQAAHEALSLANFARRGESSAANSAANLFNFFRPAMMGAVQVIDSFLDAENNVEATMAASALGGIIFGLAVSLSGEDEEGNNRFLTEGVTPTHLRVYFDDQAVQIPWGYNAFSALVASNMHAWHGIYGDRTFGETAQNILSHWETTLSPLTSGTRVTDSAGSLNLGDTTLNTLNRFTPSALRPLVGLAANMTDYNMPINRTDGIGGAGILGSVYDSTGRQTGSVAEAFTRNLFDQTGVAIGVGTADYMLSNYASGVRNFLDMGLEMYRGATGGSDYDMDFKRASLGIGGFVPSAHSVKTSRYYNTLQAARDLANSENSTEITEQEYRSYYGDERYEMLKAYQDYEDGELRDVRREVKAIRRDGSRSMAERTQAIRDLQPETDRLIGEIIGQLGTLR